MKRLFMILAILCLLLCGCDETPVPKETDSPTEVTQPLPTEPVGSYLPDSEIEKSTAGAVRSYRMEMEDPYAIQAMAEDLLVFSGGENTVLTVLSGENLFATARAELNCHITPEDPTFLIGDKWITYYDPENAQIVYLDDTLKEINRVSAPAEITGAPVLSPNQRKIYYSTASAVRVLDLDTQIDRMLKEITSPNLRIDGILLNGTVLQFSISRDGADWTALYISPETGEILWEQLTDLQLTTGDDTYYGHCTEGVMEVYFFGKPGKSPQMLHPEHYDDPVWFIPARNAAVSAASSENQLHLSYYDLGSGLRASVLTLPEADCPRYVEPAAKENQIYLFLPSDEPLIYRWDIAALATNDTEIHTSPKYTMANPDAEGLSECLTYAQQLGEKYGIKILLGAAATQVQPWDYILTPEHHTPVIMDMLTRLDAALAVFPEGFFTTLAEGTSSKAIQICLVRELQGSYESGNLTSATGTQFWDNEDAYVALSMEGDFTYNVYHELFHVIDTRVMSECSYYDKWGELNPKGFKYDYDYIANQQRDGSKYLEASTRSFIDTYSMSFPKEDRARIMEYACGDGNEDYFATATMQQKLKQLCQGIRKAFGLQKSTEVYLWEQYLETPIAYQNKK